MPTTFTISSGSGSERVIHYPKSDRDRDRNHDRDHHPHTDSGGSASVQSHVSSAAHSFSGSESWSEIDERDVDIDDGIAPGDSASRSRQHSTTSSSHHHHHHRYAPEAPIPPTTASSSSASKPHRSSRRASQHPVAQEEPPSRRHSTHPHHTTRPHRADSRRVPSDESTESIVASHDDYPYGRHGVPPPPPRGYPPPSGYRHVPAPGHSGYPPNPMNSRAGYPPDPFAAQALIHRTHTDPFGYAPPPNPFASPDPLGHPFSPLSSTGSSYFAADPHAPPMSHHTRPPGPPRPQSYVAPNSHYGSELMSPYGHPGYGGYGMPNYPPAAIGWGYGTPPPPPRRDSPPPKDARLEELEKLKAQLLAKQEKDKEVRKNDELESLKLLIQKHEEARVLREKEMIAKAEADAAAAAAAKARDEEEKKKKDEIAAATKKAKEDAEKTAEEAAKKFKEEADKKLKEAEVAKEEAEKKQKALEEEAAKNKPPPDHTLAPIKFKDAVGRKFSFPFHLCKTWKGMEGLIRQAFAHVDMIGEHVQLGHYDLTGPDGEIILPQVWDTMIKPDWEVNMHMWPMAEAPMGPPHPTGSMLADDFAAFGLSDVPNYGLLGPDPKKKGKKDSGSGKKKKSSPLSAAHHPGMPPPPPPPPPPGVLPDPMAMAGGMGYFDMNDPQLMPLKPSKSGSRSGGSKRTTKSKEVSPFAAWFAGASSGRSSGSKKR